MQRTVNDEANASHNIASLLVSQYRQSVLWLYETIFSTSSPTRGVLVSGRAIMVFEAPSFTDIELCANKGAFSVLLTPLLDSSGGSWCRESRNKHPRCCEAKETSCDGAPNEA